MFYNCNSLLKKGAGDMTDRERELLTIIRGSRDPAALMLVAAEAITACLRPPGLSESPSPAALALVAGKDQEAPAPHQ